MTTEEQPPTFSEEEALGYRAPFLLRRLVDAGVVDKDESAELVFTELKRYMVLSRSHADALPMFSATVDAAWHQFVLFTHEYQAYCSRCLGRFLHHVPAAAPAAQDNTTEPGLSWAQFTTLYESRFGALPWVWEDAQFVRVDSRIKHSRRFRGGTRIEHDATRVHLVNDPSAQRLCSVEHRARPALEFIAQHKEFLVRELPGLRSTAERLALVQPLVRHHILDLAI